MNREKEKAEKWKLQKKKFEALEEERRKIREGTVNANSIFGNNENKADKWKEQKKKFEALEEERRRIREGNVNQDTGFLFNNGRTSPSVSSRVNFFRQKI